MFAWLSRAGVLGKKLLFCCDNGANTVLEVSKSTNSATLSLHAWELRTVSIINTTLRVIYLTRRVVLDLKEVHFAAEVMTVIEHGKKQPLSIIRFTQERGAASSFHRVVDTMKSVFEQRELLVDDKSKRKMMIKTLDSA